MIRVCTTLCPFKFWTNNSKRLRNDVEGSNGIDQNDRLGALVFRWQQSTSQQTMSIFLTLDVLLIIIISGIISGMPGPDREH